MNSFVGLVVGRMLLAWARGAYLDSISLSAEADRKVEEAIRRRSLAHQRMLDAEALFNRMEVSMKSNIGVRGANEGLPK